MVQTAVKIRTTALSCAIDKSLESRMKSVGSLGMKIHLNMRRIKDTKSSVLEYQDLSGYD